MGRKFVIVVHEDRIVSVKYLAGAGTHHKFAVGRHCEDAAALPLGVVFRGASTMAVNKVADEVAFVIRGDVYATSVKYPTTVRITNTPGQERRIDIAPDGRSVVYDSEREGNWQLFISKIKNPDEKKLAYATEFVEEPLYSCETSAQQPVFSPDGKKVAFLEDRTILKVIDVNTKEVTTALDGKYNYSYTDGDISFAWRDRKSTRLNSSHLA